jgi:hypothetical protein
MQGKDEYDSHATIKKIMLSFAGCNNNHIAPHNEQQHEYAEIGCGKPKTTREYIQNGLYAAKGK